MFLCKDKVWIQDFLLATILFALCFSISEKFLTSSMQSSLGLFSPNTLTFCIFHMLYNFVYHQRVKRLPTMWETWVRSLGQEDPLEKALAPHSSTLAWKILWMEKPGRVQSMGSQRVGHDWATSLSLSLYFHALVSIQCCDFVVTALDGFLLNKWIYLPPKHLKMGCVSDAHFFIPQIVMYESWRFKVEWGIISILLGLTV